MIHETVSEKRTRQILISALVLALALRLVMALSYPGFISDLKLYKAWAMNGARDLWNIYNKQPQPDYPPLYLYILALIGKAINHLTQPSQTQLHYILLKLPSIFMDLAMPLVLFCFARGRRQSHQALFATLFLLFNPVLWINSSLWGQTDAFYGLLVLLFCLGMVRERFMLMMASVWLLLLLKPTGIFILPVVVLEFICRLRMKKGWSMLKAGAISLIPCLVLVLPFIRNMGLPWLIRLYVGGAQKYGYGSQRAPNLMALLGGDLKPDSHILAGGMSYFSVSLLLLALFGMLFAGLYFRYPQSHAKPALVLLWFSGIYFLSVRMHERYNYVQVLLLALCLVIYKDRRFLGLFTFLSVIASVNHFSVLYFSNRQETRALWLPFLERLTVLLAVLNLLAFAATVILVLRQLRHISAETSAVPGSRSTKAG